MNNSKAPVITDLITNSEGVIIAPYHSCARTLVAYHEATYPLNANFAGTVVYVSCSDTRFESSNKLPISVSLYKNSKTYFFKRFKSK